MKTQQLIIGFVAGITSGIILTSIFAGQKLMANNSHPKFVNLYSSSVQWPDSLDQFSPTGWSLKTDDRLLNYTARPAFVAVGTSTSLPAFKS